MTLEGSVLPSVYSIFDSPEFKEAPKAIQATIERIYKTCSFKNSLEGKELGNIAERIKLLQNNKEAADVISNIIKLKNRCLRDHLLVFDMHKFFNHESEGDE